MCVNVVTRCLNVLQCVWQTCVSVEECGWSAIIQNAFDDSTTETQQQQQNCKPRRVCARCQHRRRQFHWRIVSLEGGGVQTTHTTRHSRITHSQTRCSASTRFSAARFARARAPNDCVVVVRPPRSTRVSLFRCVLLGGGLYVRLCRRDVYVLSLSFAR